MSLLFWLISKSCLLIKVINVQHHNYLATVISIMSPGVYFMACVVLSLSLSYFVLTERDLCYHAAGISSIFFIT